MASHPAPTPEPSALAGWRSLPRNVWIVTLTSFLTDISSEMVFNLLPLFLSNVLGVKTNIIGLIEGLAETTASVLKVFSGWLSDRLGRRKGLTMAGYGLSAAVKPFLYVVTGWWGVLAVRFTDRVGKGIRTAPRDALIADTITPEKRGAAFGLHRAGDTAGAALGVLLALIIVLATQSGDLTLSRHTFQVAVLISIIPAVLAVIVLGWAHDVPVTTRRARPSLSLRQFDARFRWLLLAVVIFALGNSADAFLILRAQDRGVTVPGVLGMLLAFNVVYALIAAPAGALSDRVGRRRLIVGGWLAYGVIYLGFALVSQAWQMIALYVLYGAYYGVTEGAVKALVADLVAPDRRGTAYGVYNAAVGLAALPASLIAGILWEGAFGWDGLGASAPFFFGAVLALAAVSIFALTQRAPLARE